MRATHLTLRGFRSYGTEPQTIRLDEALTVVHADNSQGKTSLLESVEFLFSGGTSRRSLLGGSPSEFNNALRNVHLAPDDEVFVEMGLLADDGSHHLLRRELDCDYEGANPCNSTLSFDGLPIDSVADSGLMLMDPPLEAPVLLEHTLRYVVSAKPGDRSAFFKAVLEVADLDDLRDELQKLTTDRASRQLTPLLLALENLSRREPFGPLASVSTADLDREQVAEQLSDMCARLAPEEEPRSDSPPARSSVQRLQEELEVRRRAVFPVDQLRAAAHVPSLPSTAVDGVIGALTSYTVAHGEVEQRVVEALPLLRAALQMSALENLKGDGELDCPLCETDGALNAVRVDAIRQQVELQEDLPAKARILVAEVDRQTAALTATVTAFRQVVPTIATWDDEEMRARSAEAAELAVDHQSIDQLKAIATEIYSSVEDVAASVSEAVSNAVIARDLVATLEQCDASFTAGLNEAIAALRIAQPLLRTQLKEYDIKAAPMIELIASTADRAVKTEGWADLIELTENVDSLVAELADHQAVLAVDQRIKNATKAVEVAAQKVLVDRVTSMSDEIASWWSTLRPDELTRFDKLSKKGTGKRFLDLTVALQADSSGIAESRNALAVLSNSQLNALGLASFLARCNLTAAPFVLLDDPVPGSDTEHRVTFATDVVSKLLDTGTQVVVSTHDLELADMMETAHRHLGVDEYEATLVDFRAGTQLLRKTDEFEKLLQGAKSQLKSPLAENRRTAGNKLRVAAERLAKQVIVNGTASSEQPRQLSDFDGKNLSHLRPLVAAYATEAKQNGQWEMLSKVLNDANHDAPPPDSNALQSCFASLVELKKAYGLAL